MRKLQRSAFDSNLLQAKELIKGRDYSQAFYYLERAHIIGQNEVIPHTLTHLYMLKIG